MKKIDRVSAICDLFCHAYYSFLPTSHVSWCQTEDMITLYWEMTESRDKMEELQVRMMEQVEQHSGNILPVSGDRDQYS